MMGRLPLAAALLALALAPALAAASAARPPRSQRVETSWAALPRAWPVPAGERSRFAEALAGAGEEVRLSARTTAATPAFTSKANVNAVYQLLKDVVAVLDKNSCPYWLEGGTFLGAKRSDTYPGLIKWDDDFDLGMEIGKEGCFTGAEDDFKKLGICTLKWYYGYKVFRCEGTPVEDNPKVNFPFGDIFLVACDGDLSSYPRTNWYKKCRWDCKDIPATGSCAFGPLELSCIDSTNYLDRCYGKSWKTKGKQGKNHATGDENAEAKLETISATDAEGAKPGKLADNSGKLDGGGDDAPKKTKGGAKRKGGKRKKAVVDDDDDLSPVDESL